MIESYSIDEAARRRKKRCVMNERVELKLNNDVTQDVSELLELTLQYLDYSREQIIHYSFLVENALYEWRQRLPENAELWITRRDTGVDAIVTLSIKGERVDPFDVEGEQVMTMNDMVDKLLSGVGSEIKYSYRRGVNRIRIRLPKKREQKTIFLRNLLILMLPIALQNMFQCMANNADAIILSFLDANAMSAVALVTKFCELNTYLLEGILVGNTVLLAQFWGLRDRERSRQIAGIALKVSAFFSALMALAAFAFPQTIMSFYTDIPELMGDGVTYLRLMGVSFLIIPFYRVPYSIMATTGHVKKSVLFAFIGCAVNLLMNLIFVFGLFGLPSLGVFGAGLATVISGLFQVVLVVIDNRLYPSVQPDLRVHLLRNPMTKTFFKTTFPTTMQFVTWNLASNFVSAAIGHMGADILAANSMLLIVAGLLRSFGEGAGRGGAILIGNLLGKGKLEEAKQKSKWLIGHTLVLGLVVGLVFALAAFLVRFLPTDLSEGAILCCNAMIGFYACNTCFSIVNSVLTGSILHAGGDSSSVLIADTVTMWGVMVPLALFGGALRIPIMLLIGLLNLDELFSFPLKLGFYRRGKWLRNLTESAGQKESTG